MQSKKKHRATIAELAKKSLAGHVISPEQEEGPVRMWLCHKPGTGMYHYRVVAAPGMLLVYGDIGDHMLQNHDKDLVPWLKDAIKSPDYLISKFVRRPREFFPDEATHLLNELIKEAEEYNYDVEEAVDFRHKVLDNWNEENDDGHEFGKAFYEAGGDPELIDRTYDYDSSVYWTVECLKKFVELHNEHIRKNTAKEEASSSCIGIT